LGLLERFIERFFFGRFRRRLADQDIDLITQNDQLLLHLIHQFRYIRFVFTFFHTAPFLSFQWCWTVF